MNLSINLINPTQAHESLQRVWLRIKAELMAGNKQVLTLQSFDEVMSHQQRKFLHGFVLTEIAKQAVIDGRKFSMPAFKEHYRKLFLGDKVVEVIDIKTGASKKELQRVSTESLGVKKMNEYIEKVCADAANEFGVVFGIGFDEWAQSEQEDVA